SGPSGWWILRRRCGPSVLRLRPPAPEDPDRTKFGRRHTRHEGLWHPAMSASPWSSNRLLLRRFLLECLARAEIDFLHARVITNFKRLALCDQPAAGQHNHAIGVSKDHIHAVFGKQHRHITF